MLTGPQAPPVAAAEVFGDRIDLATAYADLLATAGVERGLLGPREADKIWDRHLLNCAGVASLIPTGDLVCDVGSGAGLPGLVVAIIRPDVRMVLLEPLLRRTRFLDDAVNLLALKNTSVVRGRAEEHAGMNADSVLARAVAPLDRLAAWVLPLLRSDGQLLAMKGDTARAELEAAEPQLRQLGAQEWELIEVTVSGAQSTHVIRVKVGPVPGTASPGRVAGTGRGRGDGGRL